MQRHSLNVVAIAFATLWPAAAAAQNIATTNWGVGTGASGSNLDSANAQTADALLAGSVISARKGMLGGVGAPITIETIGSQTVISNSISGSNISANISASQTSTNSGNQSNSTSINSR